MHKTGPAGQPATCCTDIRADLVNGRHDTTSYFRMAFIGVRQTAENAPSDGFVSNFSGAAFCLPINWGLLVFLFISVTTFPFRLL